MRQVSKTNLPRCGNCIPLPPSETTIDIVDSITLNSDFDVHGFMVRHFLPVLDEAVLRVNWSRLDVTYDIATYNLDTCDRPLFDARRRFNDPSEPHSWDDPWCVRALVLFKELNATGHLESCNHPKYVQDAQGNVYVCNGYFHAFAMQFNKKLAFMANMKVRLARSRQDQQGRSIAKGIGQEEGRS